VNFTPATMPSRTPALAWPTVSEYRQRIEEEIAPRLRSKGATDAEVAQEVVREAAKRRESDGKLREAHRDLEAFFVGMVLSEMKKSVRKDSGLTDGGRGEEIFDKMLTEQQAKAIAGRGDGLGIATMLDQAHLRKMFSFVPDQSAGGQMAINAGAPAGDEGLAPSYLMADASTTDSDPASAMRLAVARNDAQAAYAKAGNMIR